MMNPACQLCECSDFEAVSSLDRHGQPLQTVLCRGCGVVTNHPIPTDEELAAFYRSDYRTAYKGTATPRMRQVWRNFKRMQGHLEADADFLSGRRSCLDLGSGSGEFMYLAQRLGVECLGIEPNGPYASYSRDMLGLDVRTQTLEETSFEPGSFDLIRLSHVMEHMRDPVRSLSTLREWLATDGVIYIEVPDIEAEARQKARGKLFHYGHIFNFNPWTLRAAARRAGLAEHPLSVQRHGRETRGYFGQGRPTEPRDAANAENANRMAAALKRHYERLLPEPESGSAFSRGVSTIGARLGEIVAARRFSTPREIGDYFATRLGRAK